MAHDQGQSICISDSAWEAKKDHPTNRSAPPVISTASKSVMPSPTIAIVSYGYISAPHHRRLQGSFHSTASALNMHESVLMRYKEQRLPRKLAIAAGLPNCLNVTSLSSRPAILVTRPVASSTCQLMRLANTFSEGMLSALAIGIISSLQAMSPSHCHIMLDECVEDNSPGPVI